MKISNFLFAPVVLLTINSYAADDVDQSKIGEMVDKVIRPVMQKYNIPGMALAISINGKNYFYNYGVASKASQQGVTSNTLFELGSISKTFTATLASFAQVNGKLALSDSASKYLPSLRGSSFDNVSVLNLGTHTSGGLPQQVPDNIDTSEQLMEYFKHWKPAFPAGTDRTYSNPGIGMLGMIAAKSMHESFDDLIEKTIFPGIGMRHSYINVPTDQVRNYAQGYTKLDVPIRMKVGVLASEAYGVKSNTVDMLRFIEANMQMVQIDEKLQSAITATHTGYFKAGDMTQDLVWEQYPYPAALKQLLSGNADTMAFDATASTKLSPPLPPQTAVLINKTGSTNGFGAYVAFIPAKKIGIVMLSNKNYPNGQRVTAAYEILKQLDKPEGSKH